VGRRRCCATRPATFINQRQADAPSSGSSRFGGGNEPPHERQADRPLNLVQLGCRPHDQGDVRTADGAHVPLWLSWIRPVARCRDFAHKLTDVAMVTACPNRRVYPRSALDPGVSSDVATVAPTPFEAIALRPRRDD